MLMKSSNTGKSSYQLTIPYFESFYPISGKLLILPEHRFFLMRWLKVLSSSFFEASDRCTCEENYGTNDPKAWKPASNCTFVPPKTYFRNSPN